MLWIALALDTSLALLALVIVPVLYYTTRYYMNRIMPQVLAVKQMEAAVFARVRERFITRIDNRAVELHPLEQIVVDIIGALADLEMAVRAVAQEVAAQLRAGRRPHPPRADKKLPQSEEGQE